MLYMRYLQKGKLGQSHVDKDTYVEIFLELFTNDQLDDNFVVNDMNYLEIRNNAHNFSYSILHDVIYVYIMAINAAKESILWNLLNDMNMEMMWNSNKIKAKNGIPSNWDGLKIGDYDLTGNIGLYKHNQCCFGNKIVGGSGCTVNPELFFDKFNMDGSLSKIPFDEFKSEYVGNFTLIKNIYSILTESIDFTEVYEACCVKLDPTNATLFNDPSNPVTYLKSLEDFNNLSHAGKIAVGINTNNMMGTRVLFIKKILSEYALNKDIVDVTTITPAQWGNIFAKYKNMTYSKQIIHNMLLDEFNVMLEKPDQMGPSVMELVIEDE